MIEVLFEGVHTNHFEKDFYTIDPLSSSVTLIKEAGKNILVDTGSFNYENLLLDKLRDFDLTPEKIDAVILTHYHLDHTANLHLFKKALVYASHAILDMKSGAVKIFKDFNKMQSPEGIELIETPGHTPTHISVVYKFESKTYVVAGDAYRHDIVEGKAQASAYDKEKFKESTEKILKLADIIIPGHGNIIENRVVGE